MALRPPPCPPFSWTTVNEHTWLQKIQQQVIGRQIIGNILEPSPYLTEQSIRGTFAGTQEPDENHRRLTPWLQEMLRYEDTRTMLMRRIQESSQCETERLLRAAWRKGGQLQCDVAILGGGPHGVAAAMMVREAFPSLGIFTIDEDGLGGQ